MKQDKKILIAASEDITADLLLDMFEGLYASDFYLSLASNKNFSVRRFFLEKELPAVSARFGPKNRFAFRLALPLLNFLFLMRLVYHRYRYGLDTVICIGDQAQAVAGPAVDFLRLNHICLALPESGLFGQELSKDFFTKQTALTIGVFLNRNREKILRHSGQPDRVRLLPLSIRLHQNKFQDNIFHKIAQAETLTKKFFNVGIVNGLESEDQVKELEIVFEAIRQSRQIIPNIQLIVIGDGAQKKKLLWLAKKLELESLVWLVGEQHNLRKWLDSFDAFVTIKTRPELNDLILVLKAMESGLPIIAPAETGFEELIDDGTSGLLADSATSEALAAQIIRLRQDKRLKINLRQAAREKIEKNFSPEKTLAAIKEIL